MSEPVGNGPRGAVPSNSIRARESDRPVAEPRETLAKVIQGTATTRKAPWYKRAAQKMVADDATSISEYIIDDVILPNLRNMIRDIVVGGVDRTLYGGSVRGSSVRGSVVRGSSESIRNKYNHTVVGNSDPRPQLSRQARASHNFDDIVLPSREEAVSVINSMIDRVNTFGAASVADLFDLCGMSSGTHADVRWGWVNLEAADVRQHRSGWLLVLPPTQMLSA